MDNCRIGPQTFIIDADFHGIAPDERNRPGETAPVLIGENVWIGARSVILKGVHIGKDSIIGAGSVVSKDVLPGEIVAGNPIKHMGSVYNR